MPEREPWEEVSKKISGKIHRVLVWSEVCKYSIEPEQTFTIRAIQRALAPTVQDTTVQNELDILASLKAIEHRTRRREGWPYVRVESPHWLHFEAAVLTSAQLFPEVYGEAAQKIINRLNPSASQLIREAIFRPIPNLNDLAGLNS